MPCRHLVYLIMISIETRVAFFLPSEPSFKNSLKGDGNHIHVNKKEILSIICFIKMFHIFLFLNFNYVISMFDFFPIYLRFVPTHTFILIRVFPFSSFLFSFIFTSWFSIVRFKKFLNFINSNSNPALLFQNLIKGINVSHCMLMACLTNHCFWYHCLLLHRNKNECHKPKKKINILKVHIS